MPSFIGITTAKKARKLREQGLTWPVISARLGHRQGGLRAAIGRLETVEQGRREVVQPGQKVAKK